MRTLATTWGRASIFALTCGPVLLGAAYAQQPGETQGQESASGVGTLVITAERRTENLQTTAISATVLSAESLENKSVVGLTSLQFAAPGVKISDYASANTFNIRGIGQARVDIDLPSGVVIYRDGVPTLTGYFQNAPYFDLASVEVLRGPQGTFVGKSASAGAVFIRTRDPQLNQFGGNVVLGVGNHRFNEETLVVNQPFGDEFALRISAHHEGRGTLFDSITSNPLPGGTNWGGPFSGDDNRNLNSLRVGALWQPVDDFTAILKVDLDHLDFGSHATSGLDPITGVEEDVSNPIVNGPHTYIDKGARTSLNLSYEFPGGTTLNSLSGFSTVTTTANWDVNGSNPAPFGFESHGVFTNWSQEFNLLSPEDQRVRWVVGLFGQRYLNDIPDFQKRGFTFFLSNSSVPSLASPWIKNEDNYAVFGQLAFDLSDAVELQVGARWGHYEFDQFTDLNVPLSDDPPLKFSLEGGGVWSHFEEDSTDWKVNLNWKVTDDQFLYALVSRGHTPGSINLFPPHPDYKEMSVINYEAGWKGGFADQQIQTQLAAYYQTFKDYQAYFACPLSEPACPTIGGQASLAKNALADSTIYGVEFGAQAHIGDWSWDISAAYSKSELGSFGVIVNEFQLIYGGPAEINLDGARTPFAPEYTGNAGISYTFHLGGESGMTMTPRVDVAYFSDSYANLFQNRATLLEGQTLLNGQLRFETDNWSVNFWGTNLSDERYPGAKQNVTGVNGVVEGIVYLAPPRQFGVRIGHTF